MDKKIFFSARGPVDEPGAWARLMTMAEVQDLLSESLATAGATGRPFKTVRVERHEGGDARISIWGEEEPGVQLDDYGNHDGLRVELDGTVVFNSLKPAEDDEEHDPDCDECAK
jgi:hypothetical protein